MVAGDDRGRRGERVVLVQERVGRRDRRLRHEEAVVHVAEVDEARHLAGMGVRRADQDVVVVRVAVDDAASQAGEGGHDLRLEAREHPLDERPPLRLAHVPECAADPRGAREVPLEVPVGLGVVEAGEGRVELAEQPPEAYQHLRRARSGLGERCSRQPAEHPDEPRSPVRPRDDRDGLPIPRRHDPRHRQVRRPRLDPPQGRALQVDEAPLARRVHRLQDVAPAVRRREAEVVVELAGQGESLDLEAVEAAGERPRGGLGQGVGGATLGQHGGILAQAHGRDLRTRRAIRARLEWSSRRSQALSEYGPPNGGRC